MKRSNRFIFIGSLLLLASALAACNGNGHKTIASGSKVAAPLNMPADIGTRQIENYYPLPIMKGQLPGAREDKNLMLPPGSEIAAKNVKAAKNKLLPMEEQ